MSRMSWRDQKAAVWAGLAGATVLTVIHESARQVVPHAPRTDVLGSRAIVAACRRVGLPEPKGWTLYGLAILADLSSNGAIYAAIPLGDDRTVYRRATWIGLLTGLSALVLPPLMGLGQMPGRRTPHTQVMTLLWYTLGALGAAGAWQQMQLRMTHADAT